MQYLFIHCKSPGLTRIYIARKATVPDFYSTSEHFGVIFQTAVYWLGKYTTLTPDYPCPPVKPND